MELSVVHFTSAGAIPVSSSLYGEIKGWLHILLSINTHKSTTQIIVCCRPHSSAADLARPRQCRFVRNGSSSEVAETVYDEVGQYMAVC